MAIRKWFQCKLTSEILWKLDRPEWGKTVDQVWTDGAAAAALLAGLIAGVSAIVASLVSLLSGILNRHAEARYRNRELAAEISTASHILETALTQLHGPKADFLPTGAREALIEEINVQAPLLSAKCLLLHSLGNRHMAAAAIYVGNTMTNTTGYLHPVEGFGLREDFVAKQERLQVSEEARAVLSQLARRNWLRQARYMRNSTTAKKMKEREDRGGTPLFHEGAQKIR